MSSNTVSSLPPGRWQVFCAAPHRMMFFGGAAQIVAVLALWSVELIGRYTGLWSPLATTIPTTWVHAFLMLFALFPFFMFGFLMTTYPRWMNGEPVPTRSYSRAFLLLGSGAALYYLGLVTAQAVSAAGVVLLLAGWGYGLAALYRVYATAPATDKSYESSLNVALAAGWLGALSYLVWLLSGNWRFVQFSVHAGMWLFLIPVLVTVSHRMIPFFSSCVLKDYRVVQPSWALPLMWAAVSGHVLLEMLGAVQWLFLADIPLLFLALYLTLSWGLRRSFEIRLLAVLHIAFAWLSVAMALYSVQSLTLLLTGSLILGKAPLHALGIGFIAGMTIAMASRVTLGHSGRPLVADDFTWVCFLGLNAAAVVRIAAELQGLNAILGLNLNIVAALAWLAFLTPWVVRYGTIYLRPRADGKPG
jgi:uncharacterized protein involved in response to NO